jgi:hypothetical protein
MASALDFLKGHIMHVHPRVLSLARAAANALPYLGVGAAVFGLAEPAFAAGAALPGLGAVTTAVQNGSMSIGVAGAVGGVALKSLLFHHDQRGDWTHTVQGLCLSACGGATASNALAIATLGGGAGALLLIR